jgi:hypothetical protein
MVAKMRHHAAVVSVLGQDVGEASADAETVIVGQSATQGRATTWTGHSTGLTG